MLATDLNMDAMEPEELWHFWKLTNRVRPIAFARELFPTQPKGYIKATKLLGCYASNKATAMTLRLEGKIESAITYENICDRIYQELPEWARGW